MLSTRWSRLSSAISSGSSHHAHSTPFFTILHNAASKAWSRRVAQNSYHYSTAHDQTADIDVGYRDLYGSGNTNPSTGITTYPKKPFRPKDRVLRQNTKSAICYLHADSLTTEDANFLDPGRCTDASSHSVPSNYDNELGTYCVWGDPLLAGYPVSLPPQPQTRRRSLSPVTSRASLYRNLTQLSCRIPPVTLPQLMDYHDLHPKAQSTRSYNLLLNMAIRTASFGSVQCLLENMAAANISRNSETHKLVIRWKIRIGAWDAAWQALTAIVHSSDIPKNDHDSVSVDQLEVLWSEFFGTLKRRSIRRKGLILTEHDTPFLVYAKRFLFLMQNRPSFSITQTKPRIIHSIAYILLQLEQQEQALQLVRTFFSHLPSQITPEFTSQCLDIIHILIVFGSRERGLKKFHEHRKILFSLLASHSTFQPNSNTLFLLLGSLRGAMQSGQLASECLASFKRRWGPEIEDRRVRLRVASLALKQGRLDISSDILADARLANEQASLSNGPSLVNQQHSSRRPRFRSIFRGIGKLEAHQIRLEKRVRDLKSTGLRRGA
ncbi:hypothetical protein EV361DRAFT_478279 [Lentinula raphanica]|nr:hypothetical protein EV361DRAFT_478279 [Lentinula raphanica]